MVKIRWTPISTIPDLANFIGLDLKNYFVEMTPVDRVRRN